MYSLPRGERAAGTERARGSAVADEGGAWQRGLAACRFADNR